MEIIALELILWAGLIFFFWALKDNLEQVESEIEAIGLFNKRKPDAQANKNFCYACPEKMLDPIGSYKGVPIHAYAVIEGRNYRFDHVCPSDDAAALRLSQRCVAPGLIYIDCDDGDLSPPPNEKITTH